MKSIFQKKISDFFSPREKDVGYQSRSFLNMKQRYVLIGAMILIIAMLLYPPYRLEYRDFVSIRGYAWIFDLPEVNGDTMRLSAAVDVGLLIAQWIGVVLVGTIGLLLFKEK